VELTLPEVLFFVPLVVAVTLTLIVQVPLAATVPPLKVNEVAPAAGAKVGDPQPDVLALGADATCKPAGNESVNATPVSAVPVFAFVIVKVSVLSPPMEIEAGEKFLLIEGGETTVTLAFDVLPVPPLVELTVTLLFFNPAVLPVTLTVKLQEAFAARVAPDKLTEVVPAVAVIVPPPQLPVKPLGVETTSPEGKLSVKPTPVNEIVFAVGLLMVKFNTVLPFKGIVTSSKDLTMLGALKELTISESLAVFPVPPFVALTLPEVLFFVPIVVAVTSTLTVQVPLAVMVPPLKVNEVAPAAGEKAGLPQPDVPVFGVAATCKPEGNESVNATPVSAVPVFAFVIVKVSVLTPPTEIGSGEKLLLMEGAVKTVSLSMAQPSGALAPVQAFTVV
jgi:hypothetical protein